MICLIYRNDKNKILTESWPQKSDKMRKDGGSSATAADKVKFHSD